MLIRSILAGVILSVALAIPVTATRAYPNNGHHPIYCLGGGITWLNRAHRAFRCQPEPVVPLRVVR